MRGRIANLLVTAIGSVAAGGAGASASGWEQRVEPMAVATPGAAADRRADRGPAFTVPAGFTVERLFAVPRDELGSWVCLTVDPQGRILASDQGEKGLARITPAPLDGSAATRVERIEVPMTAAQGLLCAFGAVYAVRNDGAGSGLYRITDVDADDRWDTVEKLHAFAGGGEHGPHAIQLSPDGGRLFVVCGNHTKLPLAVDDLTPPQEMGGIRTTQRRTVLRAGGRSRLPANWDEDQIIPRLWDPGGHAVGILAPGGYVVSVDPDGGDVELWSAGYRNAYDMAFNADGELFAYDSDMEWDYGTPWYRPTRINHATSGSDLGWRSGSGKLPAVFPDTVPPVVEVGPGSPVGVTFGYGAAFPAAYQRALFACDWTFGTIYAIHLRPRGATYSGTKEEFVTRPGLPVTDAVVGRDGCLYFSTGGRGGHSELFRVRYVGAEPTAPVDPRTTDGVAARQLRRELEGLHRHDADSAAAVETALPELGHPDRFIRYAARIAIEHQPIDLWRSRVLAAAEPAARIAGAIAIARQGDPDDQAAAFAALAEIDPASLDAAGCIDLARACELLIVRLGEPPADVRAAIIARIEPAFPSGVFELDRELASLLVALRAPGVVGRLTGLLADATPAAGRTNLAPDEDELRRLAERNAEYGAAIRTALDRRADLLQVHYAYALRTVADRDAWSKGERTAFLDWCRRARAWGGGSSFQKYLAIIEQESLAGLTDGERLALEASGARAPYRPPPLPQPIGPGRTWTVAEVVAAADRGLEPASRSFDRGARAYAAARCIVCHRFGDEGGSTGPDLTQAGGRFQVPDLVEAIVDPSRVVSDQYRATIVETTAGKIVVGRVVADAAEGLTLVVDPEDGSKAVTIPRAEIEAITSSATSLMPSGLLDALGEQEVLDLLAYVLSRGNRDDPRFR